MSRWEVFPRRRWRPGFGLRASSSSRRSSTGDLDQLELLELLEPVAKPFRLAALERLRRVLERSQLPQREFAQWVLGCADYTLTRYLRGERIPEARAAFLARLESVVSRGELTIIVVRSGELRRLPAWRRGRAPT